MTYSLRLQRRALASMGGWLLSHGTALSSTEIAPSRLLVSPLLLEFQTGRTVVACDLTNESGRPSQVQFRIFDWSQRGDEDLLKATTDVLLSPGAATVLPGETQVVRLMLRRTVDRNPMFYRLLIDELPPGDAPKGVAAIVTLRISLPVLVAARTQIPGVLEWQVAGGSDDSSVLAVCNRGGSAVRVHMVDVQSKDGKFAARPIGGNPYVLPEAVRRWKIESRLGRRPSGAAKLLIQSTAGNFEIPISFPD